MKISNLSSWPFSSILGAIEAFFFKVLIQWPLEIVDQFSLVIKYLSGASIIDIVFKNNNSNLFGVSNIFLMFIIISIVIMGLLVMTNVLSSWFSKSENSSSKLSRAFTGIIKGTLFMIGVPMFFMIFNIITSGITSMVFSNLENNGSLADIIFRMGYTIDATHTQEWINSQHYWQVPDFPDGGYALLLSAFGSIFLLIVFLLLGISLVSRIMELFLLYLISPYFGASVVHDGGHRLMVWRDLVLAKFCSSTISVLAFVIFSEVMPKVSILDIGSWAANNLLKVLFITAGSISILKAQVMLAGLIGQQTGITEGFSTLIGMKATVTAGRTAVGGIKGLIFGKKNKATKTATEAGLLGGATSGIGKTYNGVANIAGRTAANISNLKTHGLKTVSSHHVQNAVTKTKQKVAFGLSKATGSFSEAFDKSKIGDK